MPSLIRLTAPTFARPGDTTAYGAGDLVANSTTAGSVVPLSFGTLTPKAYLSNAVIRTNNNTITNAGFQLVLFASSPTVTNGDNLAFAVTAANLTDCLGILHSTAAIALGPGSYQRLSLIGTDGIAAGFTNSTPVLFPSGPIFGLLRATAAYAPANAQTFSVSIDFESAAANR